MSVPSLFVPNIYMWRNRRGGQSLQKKKWLLFCVVWNLDSLDEQVTPSYTPLQPAYTTGNMSLGHFCVRCLRLD